MFPALPAVPHPSLYAALPGWWHALWGCVSTALCGIGHPSAASPPLSSSPLTSLLVSLSQELSTPPRMATQPNILFTYLLVILFLLVLTIHLLIAQPPKGLTDNSPIRVLSSFTFLPFSENIKGIGRRGKQLS